MPNSVMRSDYTWFGIMLDRLGLDRFRKYGTCTSLSERRYPYLGCMAAPSQIMSSQAECYAANGDHGGACIKMKAE